MPKELHQSEKLTAPVYSVLRELEHSNRFFPAGAGQKSRADYRQERDMLKSIYHRQKEKYECACTQVGLDTRKEHKELRFPDLQERQLNRQDTYGKLSQELIDLQLRLHTHFLKEAGREWTHAFLITAHRQQAAIDGTKTLASKTEHKQEQGEDTKPPPPSVNLREIAANHHLDSELIAREAYRQWRAEHSRQGKSSSRE